mmetsp:Transcript_1209/g.4344  ORF Transcript_1209/g.4344 Transcript_1209/m.4344 type:complete len:239 (+) Transcript_1209:1769-2485(+)
MGDQAALCNARIQGVLVVREVSRVVDQRIERLVDAPPLVIQQAPRLLEPRNRGGAQRTGDAEHRAEVSDLHGFRRNVQNVLQSLQSALQVCLRHNGCGENVREVVELVDGSEDVGALLLHALLLPALVKELLQRNPREQLRVDDRHLGRDVGGSEGQHLQLAAGRRHRGSTNARREAEADAERALGVLLLPLLRILLQALLLLLQLLLALLLLLLLHLLLLALLLQCLLVQLLRRCRA